MKNKEKFRKGIFNIVMGTIRLLDIFIKIMKDKEVRDFLKLYLQEEEKAFLFGLIKIKETKVTEEGADDDPQKQSKEGLIEEVLPSQNFMFWINSCSIVLKMLLVDKIHPLLYNRVTLKDLIKLAKEEMSPKDDNVATKIEKAVENSPNILPQPGKKLIIGR